MANGLITHLKSSVDNVELPLYGGFSLMTGVGNCNIEVNSSTSMTLEIIGDGYFTDSTYTTVGEKTATTVANIQTTLYIKTTEECVLRAVDNYTDVALVFLNIYAKTLDFTKYRSIKNFYVKNSDVVSDNGGELFVDPLANRVEVGNDCSFKFNLAQVNNNTSIYALSLPNNNNVYGDISNLYKCINLIVLSVNIAYNVEELAVGWLSNSKTKTCAVDGKLKKVHGSAYTQRLKVVFPGGSNINITDNSDNIIASYNGSTWTYA